MKNIKSFLSKNFQFLKMKFSIHMNRRVFVMDKASNNIVFICKTQYINCLLKELGMSTRT